MPLSLSPSEGMGSTREEQAARAAISTSIDPAIDAKMTVSFLFVSFPFMIFTFLFLSVVEDLTGHIVKPREVCKPYENYNRAKRGKSNIFVRLKTSFCGRMRALCASFLRSSVLCDSYR